ncbi:hypothetical protein [Bacteroides timonensis]|uniref:hypothetical protein n=1 Tax=Bacteroides timonensis TaxID=1470345 RepID=UPI000F7B2DC8|nr:hypothetical protein [Bacteroides timonensis]
MNGRTIKIVLSDEAKDFIKLQPLKAQPYDDIFYGLPAFIRTCRWKASMRWVPQRADSIPKR